MRSFVIFLVIILLAVFVRFYRVEDLMTFRGDQGIEFDETAQILEGKPRLIGIKTSISEVRNGAVAYYFLAPLLWLFNGSPVAGSVLQTLQIMASAVLVFWYLKKRGWEKEAWIALIILLFSYPLVLFSRQTLFAYYPLFFFAMIFIASLEEKPFICGIFAGLAMQVHYSSLAAVIYLTLFGIILAKDKMRFLALVFAGFVLGFLPMIIFELRHDFFNLRMLLHLI